MKRSTSWKLSILGYSLVLAAVAAVVLATPNPMRWMVATGAMSIVAIVAVARQIMGGSSWDRRRLEQTLDGMKQGLLVADRDWNLLYVSHVGARMVGKAPSDLVGKSLFDTLPDLVHQAVCEEVRRAATEGRPVQVDVFYPPLDVWFEASVMAADQVFTAVVRDITDQRRAAQTLPGILTNASRTAGKLEQFARTMSHDLVQPLGAITTYAELIRIHPDGDVTRHATRIVEVADRMAVLLRSYVETSRADSSGAAPARSGQENAPTESARVGVNGSA